MGYLTVVSKKPYSRHVTNQVTGTVATSPICFDRNRCVGDNFVIKKSFGFDRYFWTKKSYHDEWELENRTPQQGGGCELKVL